MTGTRSYQESSRTPPSSFTRAPLTPPPSLQKSGNTVEDIIEELVARKSGLGCSESPWLRYRLSHTEYMLLENRLQSDGFVEDKLRYDFFPYHQLCVLRMPSVLHEAVISSVVREIEKQLRSRAREADAAGVAAEFIGRIKHIGSTSIKFIDSDFGRHDPDASFKHPEALYPGVVIEVSYSQKRRDLADLADEYILGSNGSIRTVIGINIDYSDKSATLSIWQPRYQFNDAGENELVAYRVLSDQEFRTIGGDLNSDPGTGLRIRLEDFAPQKLNLEQATLGEDIFISSATLHSFLCEAELFESTTKQGISATEDFPIGTKKRRRETTPEEKLNTDDELQIQGDEARAAKRSQREDAGYRG